MKKTFLLAGMHRSGSSLIANIFYHLGIIDGGEELMPPDGANPDGFYEDWKFVRLNENILVESGGGWNVPPIKDVRSSGLDDEIKKYIETNQKEVWGIKDNRLAFSFPAWEPYLENIHWVIIHRHKKAVVQSLFRTHKMLFPEENRNEEYFRYLYDWHYDNLKKFSKNYPTLNISFERIFKNPKKEIKKILEFTGKEKSIKDLINLINPDSKHF